MTKKMMVSGLLSLFLVVTLLTGCGGNDDEEVFDVTDSLVTYYPFNGNAEDAFGDNDGNVIGALNFTTDRFENSNKACAFDYETENYTNYIYIPPFSLAPSTGFTVSMWIKSNTLLTPVALTNGSLFDFRQDGTTLRFGVEPGASPLTLDGSISLNTWTYVAGTYNDDNKNGALYINGTLISSGTKANNVSSWSINGQELGLIWPGVIDDFRIYNRALTADEISQLYQYHNN